MFDSIIQVWHRFPVWAYHLFYLLGSDAGSLLADSSLTVLSGEDEDATNGETDFDGSGAEVRPFLADSSLPSFFCEKEGARDIDIGLEGAFS